MQQQDDSDRSEVVDDVVDDALADPADDDALTGDDAPVGDDGSAAPRSPRPARQAVNQPKPTDKGDIPVQICGKSDTDVAPVVPDMLIVLDRSGSMMTPARPGLQAVDRWNPSVKGVKTLTTTFDKTISFGLMVFPNEAALCAPGDVRVPVGKQSAAKISTALDGMLPSGGTPTGETMQRALQSFGGSSSNPRYVVLVTDGQPTCPSSIGTTINPAALASDKQLAIGAIDALAKANIKTFVIGYDAQLDPAFAGALNEFAAAGGTKKYYPVQDEKSLSAAFGEITKTIRSCDFKLKEWIDDPRYVTVSLNGQKLVFNDPNGWSFKDQVITLVGASCARYQENATHKVSIRLECIPQ
ncbi:MAG: vWA domain-containing protein [Polyangiales bacterium]